MISSANTAQFLVIKIREVSIFNSKAPNSFHPSDHPWKEPKKVCHRMFYHWFFCQGCDILKAQKSFLQESNIYRATALPINLPVELTQNV